MNDHSAGQMMSRPQPLMSQPPPVMNSIPVQPMPQLQSMNPPPQLINQPPTPAGMNPNQPMFVAQRGYKPWGPQQQQQLQNPNNKFNKNWKGKNANSNMDQRRMEKMQIPNLPFVIKNNNHPNALSVGGVGGAGGGYKPPSLNELQTQNRMKARKYYHPKKKFNDNNNSNNNRGSRNNRFAPYAPRNTSSFIIRAKKAGGIAELVSPCPVTPAVLPTPIFSPSREVLGDMAKEEWGVDGYGSMKGLIRLRSPLGGGNEGGEGEEEDDEGNGSSESDVEEHVEVERRLDHDLSRFEMIYPRGGGVGALGEYGYSGYKNVLENRVDDQDSHIAQLEEENLTLKERLFLMERELGDLRRRLQFLERQQFGVGHGREYVNEEVVENVSENDENESDGGSDVGGGSCANRVENEGREDVVQYVSGITVIDVDGSVKDGGLLDGVVATDAATKEDEVMGEDTVLENVFADLERDVVHDACAQKEVVQDEMLAEKDESKGE